MAKRLLATLTDTTLFLQEWIANPQRTGAVVPSSRKLAAAMAQWLPSDPNSYVLELGPGTGCYTLDVADGGVAGLADRRAQNDGLMVSRRSGTRLGGFARVDRTAASRPTEIEVS